MFAWKGAFLKGPSLAAGEARAGVKTCLSVETCSQPRTEGESSVEVFLGRARVKLSVLLRARACGELGEVWSSFSTSTEMGGQRKVPWRSTMKRGLDCAGARGGGGGELPAIGGPQAAGGSSKGAACCDISFGATKLESITQEQTLQN